eukprot:TRINITY_DN4290_c0_g2_i1.p1 TRINITY_DN4290_c0_g2~~TRINITY_DN4290_c0_g2_i1.p1  ORF type:complete len:358 (-),score=77.34 TRINITY_DN4290_c0_g2_i1:38-1111(-)
MKVGVLCVLVCCCAVAPALGKWQVVTRYYTANSTGSCGEAERVVGTHIDDAAACTEYTCTFDSTEQAYKSASCVADTADPIPTSNGFVTLQYAQYQCAGDYYAFTWGSTACRDYAMTGTSARWQCDAVDATFSFDNKPRYLVYSECLGDGCGTSCQSESYGRVGICHEGSSGEGNWEKIICVVTPTMWRIDTMTQGCSAGYSSYGYQTDFCMPTVCGIDTVVADMPQTSCIDMDASALGSAGALPSPADGDGGFRAEYFANADCAGEPAEFAWTVSDCLLFGVTNAALIECSDTHAKVQVCKDSDCENDCDTAGDEITLGECVKLSEMRSVRYACAGSCVAVNAVALLLLLLLALLH